jgi:hypothetical protein
VIEIRVNGKALPVILQKGAPYRVSVYRYGIEIIPARWNVTVNSTVVFYGLDSPVEFSPEIAQPHVVTIYVVGEFGLQQTYSYTFDVLDSVGQAVAYVRWGLAEFKMGQPLTAEIQARDSNGNYPKLISWTLFHNEVPVFNGAGSKVYFVNVSPGLYRLKGHVEGFDQTILNFDAHTVISKFNLVKKSLPTLIPQGSWVHLGDIYSQIVAVDNGQAPALPYILTHVPENVKLLPGTTHVTFELDQVAGQALDEYVVRTTEGNWCLRGPLGGGLSGEDVGFDYRFLPEFIPVPQDLDLKLAWEAYQTSNSVYAPGKFRIKIRCWRLVSSGIYQYTRCPCASGMYTGGQAKRSRRWMLVFEKFDAVPDAENSLTAHLTSLPATEYRCDISTSIPARNYCSTGDPNPVQGHTGLSFTEDNILSFYDSSKGRVLQVHSVCGLEGLRPCVISTLEFNRNKPLTVNAIQRLHGNLAVYLNQGTVFQGSTISVRVYTNNSGGYQEVTLPVTETQHIESDDVWLKVGQTTVDISSAQFPKSGIYADILVDESGVVETAPTQDILDDAEAPEVIYSTQYAKSIAYHGACYSNPTYVPNLEPDQASLAVTPVVVQGCHDPVCGISALYCYESVENPPSKIVVPQPFGFPANYVALAGSPSDCYWLKSHTAVSATSGTIAEMLEYTGTYYPDLYAYNDPKYCGHSYLYRSCRFNYAPCQDYSCQMVVVYPTTASPHSTVYYAGNCYQFSGTIVGFGTHRVLAATEVVPVTNCRDVLCTGTNPDGAAVVYNTADNHLEVGVVFEHLDYGIAHYGVVQQKIDKWESGPGEGSAVVHLNHDNQVFVLTSTGTGALIFEIVLPGYRKAIVKNHLGIDYYYWLAPGDQKCVVPVSTNDTIHLYIPSLTGKLPPNLRHQSVRISWYPVQETPRLYDTGTLNFSGTSVLRALGFCPWTDGYGKYAFFGTLPYVGYVNSPANPDNLVTVTGASGTEYILLQLREYGDLGSASLSGKSLYSGQPLAGPYVFKFYAGRKNEGAHGEMDVWLQSNGSFPAALALEKQGTPVLLLSGTYYRRDPRPDDAWRRTYSVTQT